MPRRNSDFCMRKLGMLGVILSKLEELPPSLLLKPEGNYSRAVSDGAEWKGPLRVELKLEMHPQTVLSGRESRCGDHRQAIILVSHRDSMKTSRSKGVTASRGNQAVLQHLGVWLSLYSPSWFSFNCRVHSFQLFPLRFQKCLILCMSTEMPCI